MPDHAARPHPTPTPAPSEAGPPDGVVPAATGVVVVWVLLWLVVQLLPAVGTALPLMPRFP